MARSDIPPAAVWLLLLDCCPFPSMQTQGSETADRTDWHPFDDLDAEALFFEQYYSQHPTPNCSVTDYLGGPTACRRFLARMQAAGKCCRYTEIAHTHTAHSEFTESRSGLCDDPSLTPVADSTSVPALLIFTATGCESFEKLTAVLQRFRSLHATYTGSANPILIISGFRGLSRSLPQHFAAACSETEIRVPLWILPPDRRTARIQMLCGSNDLLPTISELLALPPEPEPRVAPPHDPAATLQLTPLSLLLIAQQHPESIQRMLTITGTDWIGLRTQQYFLVRPNSTATGDHDLENCSLYQKPDDFWNVNNSISSCQEIAQAMLDAVAVATV